VDLWSLCSEPIPELTTNRAERGTHCEIATLFTAASTVSEVVYRKGKVFALEISGCQLTPFLLTAYLFALACAASTEQSCSSP